MMRAGADLPLRGKRSSWSKRVGSAIGYAVCTTLGQHAPLRPIRAEGPFCYARCQHCNSIITLIAPALWHASPAIAAKDLLDMREIV